MLDKYLRQDETIESRLDDLMDAGRRTSNTTIATLALREAQVLATVLQAQPLPVACATLESVTPEGVYGLDQVAKALDEAFEGGECPVALKGAVLAILSGDALAASSVSVGDSALLSPLADGSTPMVEGDGVPYIDRSGVDFEATIPEHSADEELADRLEDEAEDFPEFATGPQPDPLEAATVKTKKKGGGKKTAAQRAAEEAGL